MANECERCTLRSKALCNILVYWSPVAALPICKYSSQEREIIILLDSSVEQLSSSEVKIILTLLMRQSQDSSTLTYIAPLPYSTPSAHYSLCLTVHLILICTHTHLHPCTNYSLHLHHFNQVEYRMPYYGNIGTMSWVLLSYGLGVKSRWLTEQKFAVHIDW